MSLSSPLLEQFEQWQQQINRLNIRGLLFAQKKHTFIKSLKNDLNHKQIAYINAVDLNQSNGLKVEHLLGRENMAVFFESNEHFDSNLFAAISGCLKGGGFLVLLLDEMNYKYCLDSNNQLTGKLTDINIPATLCPLLKRIIDYHINNHSSAVLTSQQLIFSSALKAIPQQEKIEPLIEQQALIEKIKRVATGHSNRPLVITANRGRGKSAALGIAAAELALSRTMNIIITAPSINNLDSFYKHLSNDLKMEGSLSRPAKSILTKNHSSIKFIPVDEIIRKQPDADLLIIDEAAAIPVSQLDALSRLYNRIVFATTNHGYEGNGKGFEIRFTKLLLGNKPQTRFTTLENPIRWSVNDELEKSTFKALLLDLELQSINSEINQHNDMQDMVFKVLDKTYLATHEDELKQVFSLLINAHYQTRPADLQSILANTALDVMVCYSNQTIIAVALISKEGRFTKTLSQQIASGVKRLKGHLLPQSILTNFGMHEIGVHSFYRIMRIAVHPNIQAQGLGSRFLSHIETYARSNNITYIGASFAASIDVVNFWIKNNFHCIRFGSSIDSSSGAYSLEVLKSSNSNDNNYLNKLCERFKQAFLIKINSQLKLLDSAIVSCIILNQIIFDDCQLEQNETLELEMFVKENRAYSAVDDLLLKCFKAKYNLKNSHVFTPTEVHFLIDCLFRNNSFSQLALTYNFSGKKVVLKNLRLLTHKLISC